MNREFASIAAFGRFLDGLRIRERKSDELARVEVLTELTSLIQRRLGHESELPPPLAESTQRERVRLGYPARETLIRTGALRTGFTRAIIGPRENGLGNVMPYALYQELGGGRVPARAPMARTARENDRVLFILYGQQYRKLLGL